MFTKARRHKKETIHRDVPVRLLRVYNGLKVVCSRITTMAEEVMAIADTEGGNTPKVGLIPPKIIEEGDDIYRFTGKTVSSSYTLLSTCRGVVTKESASEKRRKFRDAEEYGFRRAPAVLVSLQEFIKKERFLKMKRHPKEHYVREQTCMAAFQLHNRVKKHVLGYTDIRELLVNIADLYDYCARGVPKSASIVVARLLHKLIMIVGDLAAAIEMKAQGTATTWPAVADRYRRLGSEDPGRIPIQDIVPSTKFFTTESVLGKGGFGYVSRVTFGGSVVLAVKLVPLDKQVQPKYAVVDKIVACMVNHPLLVKCFCTFRCSSSYVTVMEYVQAIDILKALRQVPPPEGPPMFVRQHIIAQLCLGLSYIHFKGFIHRDVKPSNLLLLSGCRLKLIDFDTVKVGMGKFRNWHMHNFYRRTASEFHDRESAGTRAYFPPEVLSRKAYGRCIDWWATGVTLYEMVCGRLPFRADENTTARNNLADVIKKASFDYPEGIEVNPSEKDFIARCLTKKPSARLCSKGGYEEYRRHIYLRGIDWSDVERWSTIDWPAFEQLIEHQLESGHASKHLEPDQRYLCTVELNSDDPTTPPLYTFSSKGFLTALDRVRRGEPILENDVQDIPEYVELDAVQEYRFAEFLQT